MKSSIPKKVLLTFDVEGPPGREDFMDSYTLSALHKLLELLERYDLRGIFFITGGVIEKVCKNSSVFKLLEKHEIGFHSSSHSVKPRIFEYADLPNYDDAMRVSLRRETSKIDPFSGKIVGSGGILYLRECFPEKNIESFRAPFDYFLPPHLEALKKLRFKFIFSGDLCEEPVFYKGLTFYPRALFIDGVASKILQINYLSNFWVDSFLEGAYRRVMVSALHPCQLVFNNSGEKLLKFHFKNPMYPFYLKQKGSWKTTMEFSLLRLTLLQLSKFQKMGFVDVTPTLEVSETYLTPKRLDIERNYNHCLSVVTDLFGYKPRFLLAYLDRFLGIRSRKHTR